MTGSSPKLVSINGLGHTSTPGDDKNRPSGPQHSVRASLSLQALLRSLDETPKTPVKEG